ncbi:MAG: TIGR03905 family TSCPD domain-containing protein [Roseburia sp.]|nr:TIGR03905 family TSCPD domain-containing protein [Anaeroplasma bactoclasticum]MCM1195694.1 TIGR03905 family TSCPD domain-containing protein [Roseburia sp.]MCM1556360.1 TIGR03905 family TSCPD domain-containing protein [Anaeroplasma bactoclasticum]
MTFNYETKGTCSKKITFDLDENGNLHNVCFMGGCNGNLKAISKLVEGKPAEEVVRLLEGNSCGPRATSCADQLAKAILEATHA